MWLYILVPIYVIVCVFLILVVLLQQGKGADVSAAFGASSSQTTFGARGATTLLERITTWSFVAFSVLAVTISLIQARRPGSVLSKTAKTAPAGSRASVPVAPAPVTALPSAPVSAASPASPASPAAAPAAAPATPATK